jgi:5-methyltetrahydropteroyltriglutamate--homocysteine methyltransferase
MIATAVSHYPKLGDHPGQQRLRQAIARADRGEGDPAEVSTAADEMTAAAIRDQEEAGLDLVTDGQVRWQDPITYLAAALEGLEMGGLVRWFETNTYYRQPRVTGEVRWTRPILLRDLEFARGLAGRPVKAVVTGPYTIGALSDAGPLSRRDLTLALARALNQELKALAAAGPAWIQVDEPAIVSNPSVGYPRDFELFDEAVSVLTEGVRARLGLATYHGAADDVPGLFELPFELFGFDFVQGPGNLRLLDDWPPGKELGFGIVDARNVRMEDERELAGLVARASAAAGADRVHVSPSCGLEFLPRDVATRKLELVARAAHSLEVNA